MKNPVLYLFGYLAKDLSGLEEFFTDSECSFATDWSAFGVLGLDGKV